MEHQKWGSSATRTGKEILIQGAGDIFLFVGGSVSRCLVLDTGYVKV